MNRTRMLAVASVGFALSVGVTCLSFRMLHDRLQPAEEMTTVVTAPQKVTIACVSDIRPSGRSLEHSAVGLCGQAFTAPSD